MEKTLKELSQIIQGTLVGDGNIKISGVTSIEQTSNGHISFILDAKKLGEIESSPLAALIVPPAVVSSKKPVIQHQNPKLAWALLLGLFHPAKPFSKTVSPQAHVSKTAKIGKDVTIEPFAYVGENVQIGDRSVIRSHAYLEDQTIIGNDCVIDPHVMLYQNTQIGNRVMIHAGSIIGCDGFGYVFDGQKQTKVPQVGNVIIEDDVEIGACVTIDRATVSSTIIHSGVKIDNLVQIAHNVEVGSHTCLSAQVGISGSSKIGKYVTMGGRVGLADHVEVGDQVILGAQSGVPTGKKIPPQSVWIGAPARPYEEMRKQVGAQLRVYETQQIVKELQKRVAQLEKEIQDLKATK